MSDQIDDPTPNESGFASEDAGAAVPTGRVSRMASLGRLAAMATARDGLTRAANLMRTEEEAAEATARQQIKTAQQMVDVLGTMKGAAMKVGQALSVLDVGLVPKEYREEFQQKLAELRNMAPKVAFSEMKKVIETDLGDKLSEIFAEFDDTPVGAASIGQVYRARLREKPAGWDTDEVAVKVQYPGIDAAVRSDLANLGILLRLAKSMAPGIDVAQFAKEITERMIEELDYELEAANQKRMARRFRDHPFIYVPKVVTSLCGPRVIVTEFIDGEGFDSWPDKPQEERNRLAEIIFTFYYGTMWRDGQYSADPHPGNSILMKDGRVAFIDFGLFHQLSRETVETQAELLRLGMSDDGDGLVAKLRQVGWFPPHLEVTHEDAMQLFEIVAWCASEDVPVRLTPNYATKIAFEATNPMASKFGQIRHVTLPAENLMAMRLGGMALGVCSLLDAEINYYRIVRSWVHGGEPPSELAKAEAVWLEQRGGNTW